jgi:putative ABC transport system permease protein
MMLALIGLLAGLPLALGLGRAVAGLLYGVAPNDFVTFASVAMVPAVVALAARYIPALRAMQVDPTVALRYE